MLNYLARRIDLGSSASYPPQALPAHFAFMSDQLLSFSCGQCNTALQVPAAMAGISGPCPSCGATITAPAAQSSPEAPVAAQPKEGASQSVATQPTEVLTQPAATQPMEAPAQLAATEPAAAPAEPAATLTEEAPQQPAAAQPGEMFSQPVAAMPTTAPSQPVNPRPAEGVLPPYSLPPAYQHPANTPPQRQTDPVEVARISAAQAAQAAANLRASLQQPAPTSYPPQQATPNTQFPTDSAPGRLPSPRPADQLPHRIAPTGAAVPTPTGNGAPVPHDPLPAGSPQASPSPFGSEPGSQQPAPVAAAPSPFGNNPLPTQGAEANPPSHLGDQHLQTATKVQPLEAATKEPQPEFKRKPWLGFVVITLLALLLTAVVAVVLQLSGLLADKNDVAPPAPVLGETASGTIGELKQTSELSVEPESGSSSQPREETPATPEPIPSPSEPSPEDEIPELIVPDIPAETPIPRLPANDQSLILDLEEHSPIDTPVPMVSPAEGLVPTEELSDTEPESFPTAIPETPETLPTRLDPAEPPQTLSGQPLQEIADSLSPEDPWSAPTKVLAEFFLAKTLEERLALMSPSIRSGPELENSPLAGAITPPLQLERTSYIPREEELLGEFVFTAIFPPELGKLDPRKVIVQVNRRGSEPPLVQGDAVLDLVFGELRDFLETPVAQPQMFRVIAQMRPYVGGKDGEREDNVYFRLYEHDEAEPIGRAYMSKKQPDFQKFRRSARFGDIAVCLMTLSWDQSDPEKPIVRVSAIHDFSWES